MKNEMPDDEEIPSFTGLNERERLFVRELVQNGGHKGRAALAAGYGGTGPTRVECAKVQASQMCNRPRIQVAIRDLCRLVLGSDGLVAGVIALQEIANDPHHKQRHSAASKLIEMSFPPQSILTVERRDDGEDEMQARVVAFALEHGIPPHQLLGRNTHISRTHIDQFEARRGHETPEERWERLARLVTGRPGFAGYAQNGARATDTRAAGQGGRDAQ